MNDGTRSGAATVFISTGIILVIVMVGLITFGISGELEKSRQMAGLSVPGDFDPDSLPAPAAGILEQGSGGAFGCDGILFSAAINGTRYVRESGGGVYYAAEVDSRFEIYTLSYGHLVKIEDSSLDTPTYRKLKYALYHCDGSITPSGLRIAQKSLEDPQV